ncbi:MAG TPA: glycoside hydrolase family 99-like domain-containing protein [Fibrobacteria bacterium]|nr:glycoside hydrolase family 99-like domain-containing protein [Fibrobacteria bacterium]
MTRIVAFHLPQYHPIAENDAWWGKGFTEWTNVTRARPLFDGHQQPHLPADLGFYDLRLPEARQAQADLAGEYGVHAFCFYHYWFGGKRLLERPFQEILDSGKPDMPFCLCWANENWTRAWDGGETEILLAQRTDDEDFRAHSRWLVGAFADPRWLRVGGKPVFLIYRASRIEGCGRFAEILREEACKAGLPGVHLVRVESFPDEHASLPSYFDAAVEFQPDRTLLGRPLRRSFWRRQLMHWGLASRVWMDHGIWSYPQLVRDALDRPSPGWTLYPCVTPMWDNSARRRKGATIFLGSTPEAYREWLAATVAKSPLRGDDDLVFVNAWNEWAEGNHLEPCQQWGRAYLEATRAGLAEGLRRRG